MTRKMKDSGIEWIGEIPEDWDVVPTKRFYKNEKEIVGERESQFERLALTLNGVIKRSKDDGKGLQPAKFETYQILYKGELVFKLIDLENVRTSRVGYSNYTGLVSPVYVRLINSDESKFGYYYFINMWHQEVFNYLGSGVRSNLTAKDLLKVPYLEFTELEKKKIAQKLNTKTKYIKFLIEQTQQSIEELKKYKQSLITEAVTKGLDPNVEMEQLGSFELPKHWNLTSLGRLFMFMGGYSYKSDEFIGESDNQVIRISNVKDYKFELNKNPVFISDELAIQTENYKIKQHDILFTMTGTKGKRDYFFTKLVDKKEIEGKNLFLNQRVGIMRPLITDINLKFYNYTLKVDFILEQVFQNETGTANQGNIGIEETKKVKVFKPPIEEQRQIVSYLDEQTSRIDKLIEDKTKVIAELEGYKKSLIYEYVTGKKEV